MKKSVIAVLSAAAVAVSLSVCGAKTVNKSGVLTGLEQFSVAITANDGTVYKYSIDGETKIDGNAENLGDTVEIVSAEYKDGVHADEIKLIKAAEETPTPVEVIYKAVSEDGSLIASVIN
ncbi:MAG: hypothetical protein ACI4A5_01615 [Hominilimicola sp.]